MEFEVVVQNNKVRLDVYLQQKLGDSFTRSQIKKSIEQGETRVNGAKVKAGKILKVGDKVVFKEVVEVINATPENIPLNIVYEDDDLAVINKPQGMTVHPAPGNYTGTMVSALMYHFGKMSDVGGSERPGIVHRIDKDTSGLIVVAKNNKAHLNLARQIQSKKCRRTYLALVEGVVKDNTGTINQPIGRSLADRKKMAIVSSGRNAVTHFKVVKRFENYTLLECDLETGRTHQIRVHTKFLGHPIVGDKTYGFIHQKFNLEGQLLHAYKLTFTHPTTRKKMQFEVPLPKHFEHILKTLK